MIIGSTNLINQQYFKVLHFVNVESLHFENFIMQNILFSSTMTEYIPGYFPFPSNSSIFDIRKNEITYFHFMPMYFEEILILKFVNSFIGNLFFSSDFSID